MTFDGPARAIGCAFAISTAARQLDIEVRSGLHVGEVELMHDDDISGIAVHIGARVSALAAAGEVLVTSTVRDLVAGSGLTFVETGRHTLKGVPGEWTILQCPTLNPGIGGLSLRLASTTWARREMRTPELKPLSRPSFRLWRR